MHKTHFIYKEKQKSINERSIQAPTVKHYDSDWKWSWAPLAADHSNRIHIKKKKKQENKSSEKNKRNKKQLRFQELTFT